jgi:hypothetical protein
MKPEDSLLYLQSYPLVPIVSQTHPVRTFPPYFPMIHSNVTYEFIPRSYEWFPFGFSDQNFVRISHISCVLLVLPILI